MLETNTKLGAILRTANLHNNNCNKVITSMCNLTQVKSLSTLLGWTQCMYWVSSFISMWVLTQAKDAVRINLLSFITFESINSRWRLLFRGSALGSGKWLKSFCREWKINLQNLRWAIKPETIRPAGRCLVKWKSIKYVQLHWCTCTYQPGVCKGYSIIHNISRFLNLSYYRFCFTSSTLASCATRWVTHPVLCESFLSFIARLAGAALNATPSHTSTALTVTQWFQSCQSHTSSADRGLPCITMLA